jgi:hypothetical protein
MPSLAPIAVPTKAEVELAWLNYQALVLAECDDPALQEDMDHQRQVAVARFRFQRIYDEWAQS